MGAWQATGATVRGALHVRHGVPNQDAVSWSPATGAANSALLAVADGHGSNRCFRSKTGAALAVTAAINSMAGFLAGTDDIVNLEASASELLARPLVESWLEAVACDLADKPFSERELNRLEKEEGSKARLEVLSGPAMAYGTTLLLAGADDRGIVLLQVGDGDILTVSAAGRVERPLPPDPRSVGNATASLARAAAWQDARTRALPARSAQPELVLAATDGYANSFADDAGFLQVGSDLLAMIRSEGLGRVSGELERWLQEVSELGSGDDVTVALLVAEERAATAR
ncbi:MAG: protein phosphatase 2C domain-containing protein [bacterium]|nr:protein phosphatase 2C domain-containing protein [bacterium]